MVDEFLDRPGQIVHDQFQSWRRQNPSGFFLSFKNRSNALLHVNGGCHHPGNADWTFTGTGRSLTKHRKVCSTHEAELTEWARKSGTKWTWCAHCKTGRFDPGRLSAWPASGIPRGQDQRSASSCFILCWNPKRWNWKTLEDDLARLSLGEIVEQRWSTGNTHRIAKGDRVFLLKQGVSPTGLMGSGLATSTVFEAPHWDAARAAAGDKTSYANIAFDRLLAPEHVLPTTLLEKNVSSMSWHPQASGVQVQPELIPVLEELWAAYVSEPPTDALPDEVAPGARYIEGAVARVLVNQYERDRRAREACLSAHGLRCVVCSFSFEERYGSIGAGFIHVHHLVPLSTYGQARTLDPVEDLRPVCANCHAMLHRGLRTPRTIEELRLALAARASNTVRSAR